ncbi:sugar carrier C-like [Olea europaea subsp. europaea]|uniref:Sugar carrier C-like n=1 Tax=Olea europaea subsp. europaea TaxID=158383 RepID=A0A8S0Q259_OLEEU|nr:sugar carrier C-like [Olea europaea subsp. europaea]
MVEMDLTIGVVFFEFGGGSGSGWLTVAVVFVVENDDLFVVVVMDDKSTNQYCKFDSRILTLFTSSLYLAALVASFFGSTMTKKFGWRKSMMLGGIIFLVGAIINAVAVHIGMLIIGRVLLDIGVGFANKVT